MGRDALPSRDPGVAEAYQSPPTGRRGGV